MPIEIMIVVFIILAAVFIVHKMLQEAFDILHIGISILGIMIGVLFLAVAYDAITFKINFDKSPSIVSVQEEESVIYAAILKGKSIYPLDEQQTQNLSGYISQKDYARALGSNYKLIMLKSSFASDPSTLSSVLSSPQSFISSYKKGDIRIYPETITFKLIRYVPGSGSFGFIKTTFDKATALAGKK
ncbi:hypothetical protein HYU11_03955 [Candidatus Woesearchaeota archaeon]|nr:hypothetical protein [Candidatus Woesearchaeota archaeon]